MHGLIQGGAWDPPQNLKKKKKIYYFLIVTIYGLAYRWMKEMYKDE